MHTRSVILSGFVFAALLAACSSDEAPPAATPEGAGTGGAAGSGQGGNGGEAAGAAGALGGSGGGDTGETFPVLEADIGPEGGEIVGKEGTPQAGVALRIPAGALAATVHVVLEPTLDPTPLPPTADGVGPQVRISPEGTTLAVPAQLTVPFDPQSRALHRDQQTDCKVWTRSGDGWSRLEQTSATEDTVTVDLSVFATSAAGVLLRSAGSTCTVCNNTEITVATPQDALCKSATGYCVSKLADPPKSFMLGDSEHLSVVDNKLYYGHIPAANQATIVRYDIATGQAVTYTPLSEPPKAGAGFQYPRGRVAVDADGSAWLGIPGYGNVRFRPSSAATVFDRDATFVWGVVIDKGAIVRTRGKFAPFVNGRENGLILSAFRDANEGLLQRVVPAGTPLFLGTPSDDASTTGPALFTSTTFNGYAQFTFAAPGDNGVALRDLGDDASTVYGAVSRSLTGRSVALANAGHQEPWRIGWINVPNQPSVITLAPNGPVASMALDGDERLFFVNNESPELFIAEPGGAITTIGLTTAAVGTTAHTRLIPRTVRYIAEKDQLLLVTRGLSADKPELYLVKRNAP